MISQICSSINIANIDAHKNVHLLIIYEKDFLLKEKLFWNKWIVLHIKL